MSTWRTSVTVQRAGAIESAMRPPSGPGRATVFDFAGVGGEKTWIGVASLAPGRRTGAHHHGRHEVALYVAKGRARIRWGDRLEFMADLGQGDFAYFAPFVPHEEINPDPNSPVDFVVVRSDNERIAEPLDVATEENPEAVF
jgi:uncharacterized RmlC-like cupin family protein